MKKNFPLLLVIFFGLVAIVLPFYVGSNSQLNQVLGQTNAANNFNGIASPLLYLLTAILLYLSFSEQYKANQNQSLQEKRDRILREIRWFEDFMDKTAKDHNNSRTYVTQSLLCRYLNSANGNEKELYTADPFNHLIERHSELYFILNEVGRLYTQIDQTEELSIKREMSNRLFQIFEIYFHGALTVNYNPRHRVTNVNEDLAYKVVSSLRTWRNTLREGQSQNAFLNNN